MAKKIIILEDNSERRAAMQRCLEDRLYPFEHVFFNAVAPMVAYLDHHLDEAIVIVLDHDLELLPGPHGRCIDPGCGRDVADYLIGKTPVCPVVLHTTNAAAGDGMEMALRDAHWETHRVVPAGDMEWIPTTWFRTVRRAAIAGQGQDSSR